MLISLQSCATSGQGTKYAEAISATPVVIDTACDWVEYIYISSADTLTPGTARQIWNHNEAVEQNCKK